MKKILPAVAASIVALGAHAQEPHPPWSYEGASGAAHWAELDIAYKQCKFGKHQSPINIETSKAVKAALAPTAFAYKRANAEMVNNGHSVQVNLPPGSAATIDGVSYALVQFHFHAPSEEQIDGKPYPMVAHLVHKNAQGDLAVVAVLFKEGKEKAPLKPLFANLPQKAGKTGRLASFDPAGLLPSGSGFYQFIGSLTTPPCSEDVLWRVMKTPAEVSPAQLAAFRKLYKMNARPVQPLGDRVVQQSQ